MAAEVATLVAGVAADVSAAEVIARAARAAAEVASRIPLPRSPTLPVQPQQQSHACQQIAEHPDSVSLPPHIVHDSRRQRAQRLRRQRKQEDRRRPRQPHHLQHAPSAPQLDQLEHAPPQTPPFQSQQSPSTQVPSLLQTPASPVSAPPSASSSASEVSVETITLQEGGQDEDCRSQSEVEADISTDPLEPTDSSTSSVIVLGDSPAAALLDSDDEEPQSELSIMQGLCDAWDGSDIEGSPEQERVFSEPPSPEYKPPSSSYASSPTMPEVIDLASDEEAMEQGGDGE